MEMKYQISGCSTIMIYLCCYLHAVLPREPKVTTGQEASHSMAGQRVNPTFEFQLHHDGVNPRETCLALNVTLQEQVNVG